MGKIKITKDVKRKFANAFMEHGAGFKALTITGLPEDFDILFKLLSDDYVNDYVEKYAEVAEVALGNARDAHIAQLEKVFKQVTGETESTVFKFTKDGEFVSKTGKFVRPTEAARLSERIEKMKGWDKTSGQDIIDIDLQLGEEIKENAGSTEEQEKRDIKVQEHFKRAGLL